MKPVSVVAVALVCAGTPSFAQERPITIRADLIIDGNGNIHRNASIVVRGSRIESVGGQPNGQSEIYDLRGLAVMPGWIDTHVHIVGHFDRKTGKVPERNSETPEQQMLYAAGNA